jgi:hypothetical protein
MHQGTFEHLAGLPCTHDSRVNLHISTDYGQKKEAGELVAFSTWVVRKEARDRDKMQTFLLLYSWQFERRAPQLRGGDFFIRESRRRPCRLSDISRTWRIVALHCRGVAET